MLFGILAGVFWALATVLLGFAMEKPVFTGSERAVFLAPFVCTFLHDFCSAMWAGLNNLVRGQLPGFFRSLKTRSARFVMLAGLIGGPVGMTGYVLAIHYMGPSVGAVASAIFPAIGAVLAFIFLKEKMRWYRWILLLITLAGVYGLSYSPDVSVTNFGLGLLGVFMCSFGWGIEAVILAKALKDGGIKNDYALQLRQSTSALVYAAILLPALRGWGFTAALFVKDNAAVFAFIAAAGLCATLSYLFYYKAITKVGASKAMALDVTYAAWAIVFTVVFTRDLSILTPVTVVCALTVIVCGILAAK